MIREISETNWYCKEFFLKEPSSLVEKTSSIHLHKLGDMKCKKGFSNQQISSQVAIHFISSGKGYFKTNQKKYEVLPGEFFLFYPGQFYQYGTIGKKPWVFTWINMGGLQLLDILASIDVDRNIPKIKNHNAEVLTELLKTCRKNLAQKSLSRSSTIQLAWSMIEYLENLGATKQYHMSLAEQSKWLIDNDSYNSITVQNLADQLEYTRASIYRQFKDTYQIGPKDYIDKIRIEKAKLMLTSSNASIKEISYSLGYSNPNYFARVFRKFSDQNPKEFRMKYLKSKN